MESKDLMHQLLFYSPEDHCSLVVMLKMSEILKFLGKCLLHKIANLSSNLHNKCRVKTSVTKINEQSTHLTFFLH